ncbi:hypothetical protein AX16_008522 [Volvariella volvacea WC 439]|nr:hypothetical protein AX16_008522 [Volvariella volvacea WC 439]
MGYEDWVSFHIYNKGRGAVKIANVQKLYGKFYTDDNKDVELTGLEGDLIQAGADRRINSCGRENSPTGTEGSFQLVETTTGRVVTNISWDCPYTGENMLTVTNENNEWLVVKNRDATTAGPLKDFDIILSNA